MFAAGQGVIDDCQQSFPGIQRDSICLLLITLLLSCCKHPVEIFNEAACKYSSYCYGMSTGFLQKDRQVGDKSRAFHHSRCLLLITLLLCCKHPVEILIEADCKYSGSLRIQPKKKTGPVETRPDNQN